MNPWRLGIVQGVLASSPGWTWLSPLVRVQDLLGAGGGPKGTDRVRPENKMDEGIVGSTDRGVSYSRFELETTRRSTRLYIRMRYG